MTEAERNAAITYAVPVVAQIPNVWTLTLNRYQRDNLLAAIEAIMAGGSPLGALNTGDWIGELRWKLSKRVDSSGPVYVIDDNDRPNLPVAELVTRARAWVSIYGTAV